MGGPLALRGLPRSKRPSAVRPLPPLLHHFPGAPACSPLQTPSGQNLALWLVYSPHCCSPAVSEIHRLCEPGVCCQLLQGANRPGTGLSFTASQRSSHQIIPATSWRHAVLFVPLTLSINCLQKRC